MRQSGYRYRFVWSKDVVVYVSIASNVSSKLLKLTPLSSICKCANLVDAVYVFLSHL